MEYGKNEGAGKKFVEGILLSFEIMGLFMLLQVVVSFAGAAAAMAAYMVQTGYDIEQAQYALFDIMTSGNFMVTLTVVATLVSAFFSVSAYWLVWGRKKSAQDKQFFRAKVLNGRIVAMIAIADVGLYYLALLITAVIAFISPQTMDAYSEMMDMALGGSQIMAMLAAVILAPINEECIMRGLILKNLQRFFSTPAVIIIQAVMFGIFHGNWVQGFYVVPVGAALGFVAVKCKSVIPCIFMHLFYNLLSFVAVLLPEFCQTGLFAISAVVLSGVVVFAIGMTGDTQEM